MRILKCGLLLSALLMSALVPAGAQAQTTVSGRVTNAETQAPLAGVRVLVRGTTAGTTTDAEGRYTVSAPANGTLLFSALGYQGTEAAVGGRTTIDVALQPTAVELEGLVVVGYTTERRRDVTGAVASVSAAELSDQKVATVEEALRGKVPGVQISASGEPGRPAQVVIRGQTGMGTPTPLYVVDGMYLDENPNLDPDDIASIDVLKDASAAAQYGARASNGVIVITTKKGRAGGPKVTIGSYYGFQEVPTRIDMAGTAEWQALYAQAYANAGITPPAGVTQPTSVNTDWQDALFRRGAVQNYDLSVSGGSQDGSYFLSGGYFNQAGSIMDTEFDRISFRANTEARFGRVTLGENASLSTSKHRGLVGFPLIEAVRFLPTIPIYDESNPSGFGYGSDANPTFGNNPVALFEANNNSSRSSQVIGSGYGELEILPSLRYRLNLGLNYENYSESDFASIAQIRYRTPNPAATLTEIRDTRTSLLVENLLTFDRGFLDGVHHVNAVAGVTAQKVDFNHLLGSRAGFPNENLQELDAGLTNVLNNRGSSIPSRLTSVLGRMNYSFRDRYLFTGSARRDCSSRFGPSNRCGNFGAVSLGWVASEEAFFDAIPLVGRADLFKIRASTGVLGDQNIGDFRYVAPIQTNLNYYFNGAISPGAIQRELANPDIRWQGNRSNDVGLDMAFLDNALTITADYYRNTSNGLLVGVPLPLSSGASNNPTINAGSFRNTGFELGTGYGFNVGEFDVNANANFATNSNTVVAIGNGGQDIFAGPFGVSRTAVGEPVGEFYLKKMAGIFQSQEEIDSYTNSEGKVIQPNAKPGDVRYADLNDDGLISDQDRYNAGSGIPKYTAFLGLNATRGNWDAALNLRGSFGNKIFNVVRFWTDRIDDLNGSRAGFTPWTPENHSTTTPRAIFGPQGAANGDPVSDRWLESGDFVRFQNVILGYTLPESAMQRLGLNGTSPRLYVNAQNLFTITDFSNWDPDVLGFNDPLARGIDDGYIYPNVRTLTIGLELGL
jgi:TonB-linked SusC/RagA family outer membrane protein